MRCRFSTGCMLIKNDFKIPLLVALNAGARFSVRIVKNFVGCMSYMKLVNNSLAT